MSDKNESEATPDVGRTVYGRGGSFISMVDIAILGDGVLSG